jgi:NitT/TauT family transport system ATP-binding protein
MLAIEAKNVVVEYVQKRKKSRLVALWNFNIEIPEREFLVIVGPSGCGKTSFINAVAGLVPIASGKLKLYDNEINGPSTDTSMVFQEYALLPWRTVWDNVKFGLEVQHKLNSHDDEKIQGLISLVGLDGFERAFPHELSGGMRQRVGLARALATDPKVMLMDEPFAAVDAMTRELMQEELVKIMNTAAKTVIFITHSIDEAIIMGDRIVVMTAAPGRVKEILVNDLPKPRTEDDVKLLPRYAEMREHIWRLLRGEAQSVLKGVEE